MATAGAIRAGRAFIELFVDRKKFSEGLRAAGTQVTAWGKSVTATGRSMMMLGAGIAGPLLAASKVFATVGDDLAKLSDRTGIAVEELSTLKYAVGQSGGTMAEFETAIKKMQQTLAKSGEYSGMSPDEQFRAIAESISEIQDPAQRTAKAIEYFGRSGTRLLPMMLDGAKGINALQEEARSLGLQMSTEDAKAAVVFGDAMDKLKSVLGGVLVRVGAALAPALTKLSDALSAAGSKVAGFVDRNRELVIGLTAAGAAIVAAGAALVAIGATASAIGSVMTAIAGATAAVSGLRAAFLLLSTSNPWFAIATAIAAATLVLGDFIEKAIVAKGLTADTGGAQSAVMLGVDKLNEWADRRQKALRSPTQVDQEDDSRIPDMTGLLSGMFTNRNANAWNDLATGFFDAVGSGIKNANYSPAATAIKDAAKGPLDAIFGGISEAVGGVSSGLGAIPLPDKLRQAAGGIEAATIAGRGTFNGARAGQILGTTRIEQDQLSELKAMRQGIDELNRKKGGLVFTQ
jgi:uncharacterized protein YidB (DUF937 family)